MIEVRDLVKRYGRHLAVDHLSFTVPDGQIFGFLGPNGAGKSTTMNLMTGYLGPTEGEILVDGHSVTQEPEKAKQAIGYLPEQPPLYLDMTAEEYLEFAARLKKVPKGDRGEQTARGYSSPASPACGAGCCATCPRATGSGWAWPRPCWVSPRC